MYKVVTVLLMIGFLNAGNNWSQNSHLQNAGFENTNWQNIGWISQTNTGSEMIVSEDKPIFNNNNVEAYNGSHFACIGGAQSVNGLYEGTLAQEFNLSLGGKAYLNFYYRYIRESVDPGSYVRILVDGIEIWSISPHFIVDASEDYELISLEVGTLEAGNHTIEIKGYEYAVGGDLPMQFAFDDFIFNTISTTSLEEQHMDIKLICLPGMIQIETAEPINEDVQIELVDLSGKVVASSLTYFERSYSLPVEFYTSGIYILNLKTTTQTRSKKIFIQQ